jgi:hypothetical protein
MKVYKYQLDLENPQTISGPFFRTMPLDIQIQDKRPVAWCEVDPLLPESVITLHPVYTGDEVPAGAMYLKTVQHGGLVYHWYVS